MSKGKVQTLSALLVVAVIWAAVTTTLLFRGSLPATKKPLHDAVFEELSFLKQFISQYFTYDSENFWQTQIALTNLMEPKLKERRLKEISLLKDRAASKSFVQAVDILSIRAVGKNAFETTVKVNSFEEQKRTDILVRVAIDLQPYAQSTESPWGFKVQNLVVKSLSASESNTEQSAALQLMPKMTVTLLFPCAVENVTDLNQESWKYRIITSHTSEIQLSLLQAIPTNQKITFNCHDLSFTLDTKAAIAFPLDLYRSIPLSFAAKRIKKKAESVPKADRQKIENELNFIFSE